MIDPFHAWLPLYERAVPQLPWWSIDGVRCDGVRVKFLKAERTWRAFATTHEEILTRAATEGEFDALPFLREVDQARPLPPPPPMAGQVWVLPDGTQRLVELVTPEGRAVSFLSWPPPDSVLVAGPTPWGRDVPWASRRPTSST